MFKLQEIFVQTSISHLKSSTGLHSKYGQNLSTTLRLFYRNNFNENKNYNSFDENKTPNTPNENAVKISSSSTAQMSLRELLKFAFSEQNSKTFEDLIRNKRQQASRSVLFRLDERIEKKKHRK